MIDAVGNPQSVLVLGGTSEIALAVVRRYTAVRKPRVVLAARPSYRRDAAVVELTAAGVPVTAVDFDARDVDGHPAVLDKVFADGGIDVALVAFGVLGDAERAWQDHEAALELAGVNYTGAVSVGVGLAERMRKQGHGVIVALSSVAGERVRRSNFVYGSTKAGMDAFYQGLGEALRPHGVTVTVVRPGFVRTRMTDGLPPTPLSSTADQVAEVVVRAARDRRELVWAPAPLRAVMSVLRHLPRAVFRRLPA
ncbi:decaprenylphospho-beta-D-erythro-pentofuranosid-2-ulose 2-reductase [Saccharothrix sp. S26]|uniref:decaprenylphospho-beta-D-erythro-pentofuranosid- 2-ulose 2-reductase n=1 Tax=Saccharothrix sp. S26 TaxID=2907215 RepID=UPI001F163824|nr:decaprenylphospho-beta-D-erythro-pentofuranosid-2-ulose 2-reductase [Saccharothrix sp. S26]MCE6996682.1 decaprenylphospho-beta-D-erythro-pentofuranosid-2-ulose 2-reductase [Saccharothrix sp. S26]